MTFEGLCDRLAARHRITKKAAHEIAHDVFFLALAATAIDGRMAVPGAGVFRRVTRKARVIENPITRKRMKLRASKTISFRAARAVKERL